MATMAALVRLVHHHRATVDRFYLQFIVHCFYSNFGIVTSYLCTFKLTFSNSERGTSQRSSLSVIFGGSEHDCLAFHVADLYQTTNNQLIHIFCLFRS